ncbi:MAG TPA: DUF2934 domain-containing protein [Terriglobales bacterium]|jgi:hypothetical protein|nr:DUF2934 domain-containing protein [Terriglobales bacterium]
MKLEKREFEMTSNSPNKEQLTRSLRAPADLQEQVRLRAYELYEQRGKVDGFEVEDWLQAEAEFLGARRTGRAA